MPIFNIFKKEKPKKKEMAKKEVKKAEVKKAPEVKVKKKPATFSNKSKKTSDIAYRVLKEPHVTEKATDLIKINQYVFKIFPRTNKTEVKKVIEDLYGVNVVAVRIIKVPERKRKLGKTVGYRPGYRKAIIKIKEGQKIEILPR